MKKKVKDKPKKVEKSIDFSDDNDIEARAENAGDMSCSNCGDTYYITEGYDDDFCSMECYREAADK